MKINNPSSEYYNELTFNDIFEIEELQHLQDLFAEANGIASLISLPDGTPITNPSKFSNFCQLTRKTEIGCKNCFKSDAAIGCHNPSGPTVQLCLSGGLWDAGVSITVGGKHIANWLIGQVRDEEIKEQQILKYANLIGVNPDIFIKAFYEIPIMSKEKFQKIAEMLFVFVNELSENKFNNLQLKIKNTQLETASKKLEEGEEKYRMLFQNSPDAYFLFSDGLITDCNRASERLMRCDKSQIIGSSPSKLSPIFQPDGILSEEKEKLMIDLAFKNGNHTFEWVHQRFDNSAIHVEISLEYITLNHKPTYFATWRDITERKKNELALQESERSKSVLISNLPGMAYRCKFDKDWTMLFVSDQCYELTGYKKEQLIDNQTLSFNKIILPQYRDFLWETWTNGVKHHDYIQVEYEIITANNEIKWVWEQGLPIYDTNGNIEALEGLIIDITYRKRVEEEINKKNLELSEVNAEKDKFFSIIAHDLRSPFNGFLGFTQILSDELPKLSQQEIKSYVDMMKKSASNLYNLLENLLEWSNIKQGHLSYTPTLINTQDTINKGIQALLETANAKKISLIIDSTNVQFIGDEQMMTSVIRNLVSNAIKFTHIGGQITITSRRKAHEIEFIITDTGIGMGQEILDNLFSIDKETKRKGTNGEPSSGLGLILCKEFVQFHQGKIWAESEEEKGTSFFILIPNTNQSQNVSNC